MKPEHVTELVRLRMEQAHEAVDTARHLLDSGRFFQGVINRSYYAMFYAALALLQTVGKAPRKHTGVVSLFDTEFVVKGLFPKELSKDFHQVLELRHVSDYEPVEPPTTDTAKAVLDKAGGIRKTGGAVSARTRITTNQRQSAKLSENLWKPSAILPL
jgi:uncharacterized protein (UPF0332 family)